MKRPANTEQRPRDVDHQRNCSNRTLEGEDMSSEDARLRTFREWPKWAKANRCTLASNGFYYTGSSDSAFVVTDNVYNNNNNNNS